MMKIFLNDFFTMSRKIELKDLIRYTLNNRDLVGEISIQ